MKKSHYSSSRIILKNLPSDISSTVLTKKLSPYGKITSLTIKDLKQYKAAFVGFEKESSVSEVISVLNNSYINLKKIKIEPAFSKSQNRPEKENKNSKNSEKVENPNVYIKNIPKSASYEAIYSFFSSFGKIFNLELRYDENCSFTGAVLVTFSSPLSSKKFLSDDSPFMGRLLKKNYYKGFSLGEFENMSSVENFSLLKKLRKEWRANLRPSWSEVYFSPSAVIEKISSNNSDENKIKNGKFYEGMAVKSAVQEEFMIKEAKKEIEDFRFSLNNDSKKNFRINLFAFEKRRTAMNIDSNILLLRKFENYDETKEEGLEEARIVLNPCEKTKALKIAVFNNSEAARLAFGKLENADFAPKNLFIEGENKKDEINSKNESEEGKNWNLVIKVDKDCPKLKDGEVFNLCFPVSEVIEYKCSLKNDKWNYFIRIDNEKNKFLLSKEISKKRIHKEINGEKKEFVLECSVFKSDIKKNSKIKGQKASNKLVFKNIAFSVTKKEFCKLIKEYGNIEKIRIPKDRGDENRIKGYAFVEFKTTEEASKVAEKLKDIHFYGRKLVVEFAEN